MGRFTDCTVLFDYCKKMWPIKFKPHSRFALPCCIFPKQIVNVICNFPNNIPDILTFFQKSLLRNFWYEVRHSMIKSASIVRNLSKIHTFRTIASILFRFPANFNWAKPPFPRNLIHAIPPFPANLAEFYNINSAIAGVMNHPYRV